MKAQTAAEGRKTYSSSMKSVTKCKTPPKKRPVTKLKPTPVDVVDKAQKKVDKETPVADKAEKKAAESGVMDEPQEKATGDDVTANVDEETPATFGDSLVMTAPTHPTPATFDDSFASTQFDDSIVITSTTQQTQGDNPESYRLVRLGVNQGDMTDIEVSEMLAAVVSNINQGEEISQQGPAAMEIPEPSSSGNQSS
ncbi:hypothetical protein MKW98_009193, partial [Papaver atlanticum]